MDRRAYGKAWMKGASSKLLKSPLNVFSAQATLLTEDEETLMTLVSNLTSNSDPYQLLSTRSRGRVNPGKTSPVTQEKKSLQILSIRLFSAWHRKYLQPRLPQITDERNMTMLMHLPWALYFMDSSGDWCMYMTECGFLGRSHADTREGDVVVLPYGSQQPMLLRPLPDEDTWKFMGFTQVNGLMARGVHSVLGKVLPELELEERDFVLR
ncbi:hypothetical protein PRZ48_003035 [Zasmidium cellare]|uniref:Uncharacterized protein n=1 Tax=Zasmidium cellare TaxID=395010 RepID=A0ABR0EU91_ZASCE|nr:hypothetical protein PRZ48_003035 [Zasmidium cellare]